MTKVTILNGIADNSLKDFEEKLSGLFEAHKENYSFENFTIRDMDIKYCTGCFGCWVKTPGKCVHNDEMPGILKSIINSDITIFISSVKMGFVSACLKKVCDRAIPLIHPYIEIVNEECHHVKRYEKYPKLGLVLVDRNIDSLDGMDTIVDIYNRLALNLKTELCFSVLSNGSVEGLNNEINNI